MCVYQKNRKPKENTGNHIVCATAIAELLKAEGIHAEIKGMLDDDGSWVSISLENPTPYELQYISKIKEKFECNLEIERKDRVKSAKNKIKVDYVSVKVTYTKDFKNKVWSWIQSKFETDMGKLPKDYVQLDQYHVGRATRISAFQMIELVIFDRLKDVSFWKESF